MYKNIDKFLFTLLSIISFCQLQSQSNNSLNVIDFPLQEKQEIFFSEEGAVENGQRIISKAYSNDKVFHSTIKNSSGDYNMTIVFNNHFVDTLIARLSMNGNLIDQLFFTGANRGSRHYIEFYFPTDKQVNLDVRIVNKPQFDIPVYLYETTNFLNEKSQQTLINGIFFGAFLLFLIFAFISALVTQKRIYFLLFGYIFFANIFHLAEHGVQLPFNIGEQALYISVLAGLAFMIQVSHELLPVKKYQHLFLFAHRIILGSCLGLILLIVLGLYDNHSLLFRLTYESLSVIGIASYAYVLIRAIYYSADTFTYRILLFSYVALCLGFLLKPLSFLGILNYGSFTKYSAMIGQVIELICLTGYLILENYQAIQRSTKIKEEMQTLERSALQAQMNPHFIFNCLNSIQNFIMDNEKTKAMDYLSRFAKLVRQNLNASVNSKVSIAEEVEMLRTYLDLEQLRHKQSLEYSITVDPAINQAETFIGPLLIQPFVENAIKHGVSNVDNGVITVSLNQNEDYIDAIITDNGQGMPAASNSAEHQSLGMDITNKRLKHINDFEGEGYRISSDHKGQGTQVSISIKTVQS